MRLLSNSTKAMLSGGALTVNLKVIETEPGVKEIRLLTLQRQRRILKREQSYRSYLHREGKSFRSILQNRRGILAVRNR